MPVRLKAKTSPTGYLVELVNEKFIAEYPVARFDDEGYAMIAVHDGKLTRAADLPDYKATRPMWQDAR